MTYAAAVIEGYKMGSTKPRDVITKDGLPLSVVMRRVELTFENQPEEQPDWDTGTDDPDVPVLAYGTNRLQRYRVRNRREGVIRFDARDMPPCP